MDNRVRIDVINIDRSDILREDMVYIGRGSPLGNPWTHKKSKLAKYHVDTREESIIEYEKWIIQRLDDGQNAQSRAIYECAKRLVQDGKLILGCYCKPLPCHGDILAGIIMRIAEELLDTFSSLFEDNKP